MSFACAAKLTSFRPKILQVVVAASRLGLTTMLIHHKKKTSVKEVFLWCPGEDSNFHCLRQHAPEACASTNFATRASITDILLSHFKINCKHLFQKIIKISIRI